MKGNTANKVSGTTGYTLAQLAAIYTVYKDLDDTHVIRCCTCGKAITIEQLSDCYPLFGHYISRSIAPHLKFHPNNIHAQCVICNMSTDKSIDKAYDAFMEQKYGVGYYDRLYDDYSYRDLDKAACFYKTSLLALIDKFPELKSIFLSSIEEGNEKLITAKENGNSTNDLLKQFKTFRHSFRQELDELTKILHMEPIEYERL